jgi:hypothetical protein
MKRIYLLMVCLSVLCAACSTEIVVDSTANKSDIDLNDEKCETEDGDCTLRAAIQEANVSNNVTLITFDEAITLIQPDVPLPPLTASNTHIIGTGVTLDGSNIEGDYLTIGFNMIGSSYNIIQGLTITGFSYGIYIDGKSGEARYNVIGEIPGDPVLAKYRNTIIENGTGIGISGADAHHNTISGNFVGLESGNTFAGNDFYGVNIVNGAHDNLVGSISGSGHWNGGNVIGGNSVGVMISGAFYNHVSGNYIGVTKNGMNPRGNSEGIRIKSGAANNYIGIAPSGEGSFNLISASISDGIVIDTADHNIVAGNLIGTDIVGTSDLGNRFGIYIGGVSTYNIIGTNGDGTADADEGNLISGNDKDGMWISNQAGSFNIIAGNFVGTDLTGTSIIPNGMAGVTISGDSNRIGTNGDGVSDALEGNVISGNGTTGLFVSSENNWIAGNFIGTDPTGMIALGNTFDGIRFNHDGDNNIIGTNGDGMFDAAERNIVSGNAVGMNGSSGIEIYGDHNVIAGNYVGTDATGAAPLPNNQYGITLADGASSNLIGTNADGTADAAEANLISGNGWMGVLISEAYFNQVSGNLIGTDLTGTSAIPNNASYNEQVGAVDLAYGASNNFIGTNSDGNGDGLEGNLISGNAHWGVLIGGGIGPATDNVVAGNFIGTDISGTAALANPGGILVRENASLTRIGTDGDGNSDSAEANLIAGNTSYGIWVAGQDTLIAGNLIGTDISGLAPLGHNLYGVYFADGALTGEIGGSEQRANTIAYSGRDGVYIDGPTPNQIVITYNSIFSNDESAIDLQFGTSGEWFTPNDPGDLDSGPNDILNFPELTSAVALPNSITIDGIIGDGLPGTNFLIQAFDNATCDSPSQHGEGKTYLGSVNTLTNGSGFALFQLNIQASVPAGHFITSTATTAGKTSEFSECVEVVGAQQYSLEEPRCDQFDPEKITLVTFDPDPDRLTFTAYIQTEGIPGLEIPIPGDEDEWVYTAMLGNVEANLCKFEGYAGRLYCYFDIPEGFLNSAQEIKFFVNGCTPPIFTHPMVSLLVPEEPPACTRTLDEDACNAAGGTYTCGTACYCVCP